MRKSLSLLLFFLAISSVLFVGCKKHAGLATSEDGPSTDVDNDTKGRQEMSANEAQFRVGYLRINTPQDVLVYNDPVGWAKTYRYEAGTLATQIINIGGIETGNPDLVIGNITDIGMHIYTEAGSDVFTAAIPRPFYPLVKEEAYAQPSAYAITSDETIGIGVIVPYIYFTKNSDGKDYFVKLPKLILDKMP